MKKAFSAIVFAVLMCSLCLCGIAEDWNYLADYINMDWHGDVVLHNNEKGVLYFERDREKPKCAALTIDLTALAEKPRAFLFTFKAGNLYALPKENSRDAGKLKVTLFNGETAIESYSTGDIDSNRYYREYVLCDGKPVEIPDEATRLEIQLNAVWESGDCTDVYFKNFVLNFLDIYEAPVVTPADELIEKVLSEDFTVIDTLDMTDMTTERSEASRMFFAMLVAMAIIIVFIAINRVFRHFFPKKNKAANADIKNTKQLKRDEIGNKPTDNKGAKTKLQRAQKQRFKKEQRFFAVSMADIESGNLNKITEPLTLLITVSMDRFELERACEKLTEQQKTLAAVVLYIGAVSSRGHKSFFADASADFAELVAQALDEIGLDAIKEIFDEARVEKGVDSTEKLDAIEKKFNEAYGSEDIDSKLKRFISENAEEFLFDGYIEVKMPVERK